MTPNDEPIFEDDLEHHALARRVGLRILNCHPPYVVGVCGSWGAGKTSFLHKLWAYLGGEVILSSRGNNKLAPLNDKEREGFFGDDDGFLPSVRKRTIQLIWFNPWQHQFESSPLVALLHEVRQQFSRTRKFFDEAGKLTDVTIHTLLNMLPELGKGLAKSAMERGREYEAEHFSTVLTSQRFRDFFEGAIRAITGDDGLLITFIDDLDRCEGDVAYRLLEALKLYLNARNCVYVLGLDQQHLEETIARALSSEKETWRYRHLAHDYLTKMFQGLFLLPVPRRTTKYVTALLRPQGKPEREFQERLEKLFKFTDADWPRLEKALDQNLPHNPRKIKAFISSWRLYLDALPEQGGGLDWRLTLILHYLAQFEEPLFRKVEEAPNFYNQHIVQFCLNGEINDWRFAGLERPYEMLRPNEQPVSQPLDTDAGGLAQPKTDGAPSNAATSTEEKLKPPQRVFWISRLITELANEKGLVIDEQELLRQISFWWAMTCLKIGRRVWRR